MDIMSGGTGEQVPKTRFFCEMIILKMNSVKTVDERIVSVLYGEGDSIIKSKKKVNNTEEAIRWCLI